LQHQFCKQIQPALDRFQEAHYWIHMLEAHYHNANLFRWHLNAFLRALKEVRLILHMDLQKNKLLTKWFQAEKLNLNNHALLSVLSKKRDIIVHQSMLVPRSSVYIGVSDGSKVRIGFPFPVHPLEDSDDALKRFVEFVRVHGDLLNILEPDEDTFPCIEREWRLEEFDEEIVALCISAWVRIGETITEALNVLGDPHEGFDLGCRHDQHKYMVKLYDRQKVIDNVNRTCNEYLHESRVYLPTGEVVA
jgi:hypothetical protein